MDAVKFELSKLQPFHLFVRSFLGEEENLVIWNKIFVDQIRIQTIHKSTYKSFLS